MDRAGPSSANCTASDVSVNDLPKEVLHKVFSYLDCKDLISASEVCSIWNTAASYGGLWRDVQWIITEYADPNEIKAVLKHIPAIHNIRIEMSCVKFFRCKTVLKQIANLCNVRLSLHTEENFDMDSHSLKYIVREFPKIEELKLGYLKTDDYFFLDIIQSCINLKILEFSCFYCPGISLHAITVGCPSLTHLNIEMPKARDLANFLRAKKEKLQSLVFRAPPDNAFAIPLGECKNMYHVSCTFITLIPPTKEVLNAIASLPKLTKLELIFSNSLPLCMLENFFYKMLSRNVVDLSLGLFRKMSDDVATAILSCCPLIKRLSLNNCDGPLSDETPPFVRLFKLPYLEDLELSDFSYSESWFPLLLKCNKLKCLKLKSCFLLENHNAQEILDNLKLLYLDLSQCYNLNDTFLLNFPSTVTLRRFDILVSSFTRRGVHQLRRQHPSLIVNWSQGMVSSGLTLSVL